MSKKKQLYAYPLLPDKQIMEYLKEFYNSKFKDSTPFKELDTEQIFTMSKSLEFLLWKIHAPQRNLIISAQNEIKKILSKCNN